MTPSTAQLRDQQQSLRRDFTRVQADAARDPFPDLPTRSLNSAFQVSTERAALVTYAVDVSCSLSLSAGETGTVILEIDSEAAMPAAVTHQDATFVNSGTLAAGNSLDLTATLTLTAVVLANQYVRLRTVTGAGSPTFTLRRSHEILL